MLCAYSFLINMADLGDRCNACLPCLSDPGRRSTLCLKLLLVTIHAIYFSILFLVNPTHHLFDTATNHPWSFGFYLLLFIITLIQYVITANTSPSYVVDAMRATIETESLVMASYVNSK